MSERRRKGDAMSGFTERKKGGLVYMTAPIITANHAFTTRYGGVSEGELASLNLGFNRGDVRERVIENYRILGAALGMDVMAAAFLETLLRSSFSSLRMRTTKRRRTVSSRMPRIMASNISKPSFL